MGAVIVVVTNGSSAQQHQKLQLTGLADVIDEAVVSEGVGVRKPDPSIFHIALQAAGHHRGVQPTWMVGDHPVADIAGAQACGLRTGWVSHHRTWTSGAAADISSPRTVDLLKHLTRDLTR